MRILALFFGLSLASQAQFLSGSLVSIGPPSGPTVDNPVDTPSGGGCTGSSPSWTCTGTTSVSLAVATPSAAVICYTTDGSIPAATVVGTCDAGSTTYSSSISVSLTTTIKAIGTKIGYTNSGVLVALYTVSGGCGSPVSGWTERSVADTTSAVYTSFGPPPSGHPSSGGNAQAWDNPNALNMLWVYEVQAPTWTSGAMNGHGAITMGGSTNQGMYLWNQGVSTIHHMTDITTSTTFTVFAAVQINGSCTNNTPTSTPYANTFLFGDDGGYMGISCSTASGTTKLNFYVFDGAYKVIQLTATQSTPHWLMFRRDATTLYASIDGGTESTTSAGTTTSVLTDVHIGKWNNRSDYWNGYIGELIVYNTTLSGGNVTTNNTYGTCTW